MPPTKKNKKSSRRGNPAARTAQPKTAQPHSHEPSSPGRPSPDGQPEDLPPGLILHACSPPASPARPAAPLPAAPPASTAPAAAAGTAPAQPASTAAARTQGTAEAERPAAAEPETPAASPADDIPKWAAKAVEELLTPTYWLDPGEAGEPFSATIRFSGRRTDVTGKPQPRDSFWQEETVDGIVPGSGPVAITAEVRGINPGEWTVTARSAARAGGRALPVLPAARA